MSDTGTVTRAATEPRGPEDLDDFTTQIADQVGSFVLAVREVAKGEEPDRAVSLLLLEVSQLLLAGGRIGALADVIPADPFEPDSGREPDVDELRERLAELLEPVDAYSEVFDPYENPPKPVVNRISDDLADVIADLTHGLAHYRAGRRAEALWWWQFSYLSNWGGTAGSVLRALQSVVAHVRLNSPLDGRPTAEDVERAAQADLESLTTAEADLA